MYCNFAKLVARRFPLLQAHHNRSQKNPQEEIYSQNKSVLYFTLVRLDHHDALSTIRGIDHLRDPSRNKGLGFCLHERQSLGLHGILAPTFLTQEEQVEIAKYSLERYKDNLNKYLFISELQDTNLRLFFSLLTSDIEKFMPIIYTPTVGLACQKFGLVYKRPRGLFITIHDKGHVRNILDNWLESDIRAVCFTDGERILGLGDLGAFGMGIPVGKLALYTALAGIKPHQCLPVTIDVGTDNQDLVKDPLYIGLRQPRERGQAYDDLIDEFMSACAKKYGSHVLLQFEDFAYQNAFRLLEKYKHKYCTFNDDIQGTASVALAGLLAAVKVTEKQLPEHTFMFLGAGSAAVGIAQLIVLEMTKKHNMSKAEAAAKVYMLDVNGLLTTRREGGVPELAKEYGKDMEPTTDLLEAVTKIKPTILIGCSTKGGAFTPEILKQMAQNAERPIIFALSNPTNKAECTAQEAYDHTNGKCLFASGSPFPPVKFGGKEYVTGQGNNAYIFPGVALGVIASGAYRIPDDMFLMASETCADMVTQEDIDQGLIYPKMASIRNVSFQIALRIAAVAYEKDLATVHPKPDDLEALLKSNIYNLKYPSAFPDLFDYPSTVTGMPCGDISKPKFRK